MRKYTKFGTFDRIHEVAAELMKMEGYSVKDIEHEEIKASHYQMKTVIAMGNIDIAFLKEILPKVRVLVYVGNDEEVKDAILEYVTEKDIPKRIDNTGISGSVEAWYNETNTYEIYSSIVFSDLELSCKYISGNGPKISSLCRYISQVEFGRNSTVFDHSNIRDLEPMVENFYFYHETCIEQGQKYDKERLLEIYKNYNPVK